MSLQPIVENAIYHGIEQMAEDTNIYIKGILDGDDCVIEIHRCRKRYVRRRSGEASVKDCRKIDSNEARQWNWSENVQDRIHIAFGDQYGIEIASKLGVIQKLWSGFQSRIDSQRKMTGA